MTYSDCIAVMTDEGLMFHHCTYLNGVLVEDRWLTVDEHNALSEV